MGAIGLGVGDVVVAEAAVVVAAEDGPLVAEAGGDGEGVVRHGLTVQAQAVTGLATTRWSPITSGVRLSAKWGLVGG